MAIASPARTSIAISQNPGDETVQTQKNAEVDREATKTSPEVRQRSRGLVGGGLEEGALVRRVVLRISQPTQPPQLPRSDRQQLSKCQPSPQWSIPPKSTSGHNVPQCHVLAASGSSEDSEQRRVLPHEHLRQGIFRRDQPEGPDRRFFSALAESRHQPTSFSCRMDFRRTQPKGGSSCVGSTSPISRGEQCGQRTARTSTQPKISG